MRFDVTAIYRIVLMVNVVFQLGPNVSPKSGSAPSIETVVSAAPWTELFRQIPPRGPSAKNP